MNTILQLIPDEDDYKFVKYSHKYSNTKAPIYRLLVGDKVIPKNNSYKVKYKCLICQSESIVTLLRFLRRLNNNITKCVNCKEQDRNKIKNHRNFMKNNFSDVINGNYVKNDSRLSTLTNRQLISHSVKEFRNESKKFKEQYFERLLTHKEYVKIKLKILSLNNGKIKNMKNIHYIPFVRIGNSLKYYPRFYDDINDKIYKPEYIRLKCDNCDSMFVRRDLYKLKNQYKILCNDCSLTNKVFKIRNTVNVNNDKILYQSQLELQFITWCNSNNIIVNDGPKLKYYWNKKWRTYVVDFYLPKLNIIIEIKDNHCWHKDNIKTGKWNAKLKSVNNSLINKTYNNFLAIFPSNFKKCTNYLIRYSPNSCESMRSKI